MRLKFLLLILLLPASAAFARPRKPLQTKHKAVAARRATKAQPARRGTAKPSHGHAKAAPRTTAHGRHTPINTRHESAHTAPEPVHEAPPAPLPPIEVHHDRKAHHIPESSENVDNAALTPAVYSGRGRLLMPAPLKGSHEILIHQNVMATADQLTRIQDDAALEDLLTTKDLVAIPLGQGLQIDERLPLNRRYCRPWTAQFLSALSHAHSARFHTNLQVNSAVRTVEFQQKLLRTNGNAAPAEGDTASPHLTGQAVDIAKKGLSMSEIAWMRGYLLPLVQEGKIDVEEEFQQSCFHISIYKRYVIQNNEPRTIPQARRIGTSLAVALP